jgi:sarcosine oxidase delta subunit
MSGRCTKCLPHREPAMPPVPGCMVLLPRYRGLAPTSRGCRSYAAKSKTTGTHKLDAKNEGRRQEREHAQTWDRNGRTHKRGATRSAWRHSSSTGGSVPLLRNAVSPVTLRRQCPQDTPPPKRTPPPSITYPTLPHYNSRAEQYWQFPQDTVSPGHLQDIHPQGI